jgi:hypothetical protein
MYAPAPTRSGFAVFAACLSVQHQMKKLSLISLGMPLVESTRYSPAPNPTVLMASPRNVQELMVTHVSSFESRVITGSAE